MELIFVHGALVRDGAWWWEPTARLIEEHTGIRSRALALPSCGETGSPASEGGLVEDAAALGAALDEIAAQPGRGNGSGTDSGTRSDSGGHGGTDGRAVVVGHSYGGTVIAEAGAHPAIAHLVLISSYLPDLGQSQAAIMGAEPDPVAVRDAGDGTLAIAGLDEPGFAARFLQDAAPELQRGAWKRVTEQAAAAFVTPTTATGWSGVDSTYLVCTDDRSTSLDLQRRHAERATHRADLATGHHPFLSRPELVWEHLHPLLR